MILERVALLSKLYADSTLFPVYSQFDRIVKLSSETDQKLSAEQMPLKPQNQVV